MESTGKATTRKGKKILEARAPKLLEGIRNALFLKGSKTSDQYMLRKMHSVSVSKRFDVKPFDEAEKLEGVVNKNDAALFMFANHSKKRPNNIVLGRMYAEQILDLVEFGVDNCQGLDSFKNSNRLVINSRPCVIFHGDQFEYDPVYIRIRNMFLDFFYQNQAITSVDIKKGLNHVVSITAIDGGVIHFRVYLVNQTAPGEESKGDHPVELTEIGPHADLILRRHRLANDEQYKTACKQPKPKKQASKKNIRLDNVGDKRGRLYVNQQEISTIALRKRKKLKTKGQKNALAEGENGGTEEVEAEEADGVNVEDGEDYE